MRRAVIVLACMAIPVPFALYELKDISFDNRIETWLPHDDPSAMVLDWFHDRFGDRAGLLVSWDGSSLNDPRAEAFAAELAGPADDQGERTQPLPGIAEVRSPRDLIRRMVENEVDRQTAVSRLLGVVIGAGPLKVRLTAAGKSRQDEVVEAIRARARKELDLELTFLPPTQKQQEEQTEEPESKDEFRGEEFSDPGADDPYPLPAPHDFQIRWGAMTPRSPTSDRMIELCEEIAGPGGEPQVEESFYAPGSPVAVMVTLSEQDDEQIDRTMTAVREAAERAGIPEQELHMGGSPYGRNELNHAAKGSLWNPQYPLWMLPKRSPVLTSALVGIGMAFLVLQSVRLATLILLTDLFVAGIATALLPATGHTMNMVLIVMPNLMIVLTSSGAIHIANYWRHEAARQPEGAVSRAFKIGWAPCTLASFTTAVGLSSLLASVLRPVREFGLFSSVACGIALAAVLFGFPSMLRLWRGGVPSTGSAERSRWRQLGEWIYRHRAAVTIASFTLFAVGAVGLQWFRTETKVIRYFRPDARIVRDYVFLEENLAGVAPVEVVVSFDEAIRENAGNDGEGRGEDSGEEESPTVLTSVERMELVREVKSRVAAHPEISGTLALSDFRPPLEPPPSDASFLVKARYGRTVSGIDGFLGKARQEGEQALVAITPVPLEAHFGDRSVAIPEGAELWRIRAQVALMTDLDYGVLTSDLDEIVSDALSDVPGTTHVVTGMVPLFLRTQNAVVESLIRSFGLAFLAIAFVIMILLRHPLAGIVTMVPNLMPVILVFGVISYVGVPVDIGTMITASVALGIAIDDTLHQLTWFRYGLKQGLSREQAISLGLSHCGPAMSQTSAAIGFGLLMLAWADLLLVSRFGWLMAAMIGAALAADILFLPALLAGPLGSLIERGLPSSSRRISSDSATGEPESQDNVVDKDRSEVA